MSEQLARDSRVPSAFEIEQLLSEVCSFHHQPSLDRICHAHTSHPGHNCTYCEPSAAPAVSAEPARLRFEFAHDCAAPVTRSLRLHNLRGVKVKVYLSTLATAHFALTADRVAYIFPGRPLSVGVTFTPSGPREYQDELRVDVADGGSLAVELIAMPRCPHASFPPRIDLGAVPLGSSVERSLFIPPCAQHDVKFSVLRNKWDCDLLVGPLWGVVRPGEEPRRVRVMFEPSAYVTALYELQVFVPTASLTPFRIAVAACCVPAMARDRLLGGLPAVQEPPKKQKPARAKVAAPPPRAPKPPAHKCPGDCNLQLGPFGRSMEAEREAYAAACQQFTQAAAMLVGPFGRSMEAEREAYAAECQQFTQAAATLVGPFGRSMEAEREAYAAACQQFTQAAAMMREAAQHVRVRDEIVRLGTVSVKQRPSVDMRPSVGQPSTILMDLDVESACRENPRFLCQRTLRLSSMDEEKATAGWFSQANADYFVRYQILCKFITAARRAVTVSRLTARLQLLKNHAAETIASEAAAAEAAAVDGAADLLPNPPNTATTIELEPL